MTLTIRREGRSWVVRKHEHFLAAYGTHERAMGYADKVATIKARTIARVELTRARQAMDRMEARTWTLDHSRPA